MSEQKSVVIEHEQPQASAPTVMNPMAMIQIAVEQNADIEKLEKLMGLHERWEANNARKAFDSAIAAARSEIKPVIKTAEVDFTNSRGDRTNYKHETLDAIAGQVDPILSKHGLSYRFRSSQNNGQLQVTCIVCHRDGHFEETALAGPPDTSGSKNAYQAVGSAATYLQRYTLKLALGLSAAKDDDAQIPDELISDEQAAAIKRRLKASGSNVQAFCKAIGIDNVDAMPSSKYAKADVALAQKEAKMKDANNANN